MVPIFEEFVTWKVLEEACTPKMDPLDMKTTW